MSPELSKLSTPSAADSPPSVVPLDLVAARRWAMTARTLLGEARAQINALNVFPVPDGDTGTNMFLTMDGALEMMRSRHQVSQEPIGLQEGLELIARGMLLSARGNSGVILSQLARGLSEAVAASAGGPGSSVGTRDRAGAGHEVKPQVLADAFTRADEMAWAGVTTPVEGTILSVSRAAARGAREAVRAGADTAHAVSLAALQAARTALQRTPMQLLALAKAGVVDAGGAGLVLVLEALERVLSDEAGGAADETGRAWWGDDDPAVRLPECADLGAGDGRVEVMYLLTDSDPERAQHLRAHLARVGDSVLVAGGPGDWRVHVHLDDPQVALEAGTMAGRVEHVTVTSLAPPSQVPGTDRPRAAVGVVACAQGQGLAAVFAAAGAEVVRSAPGARASTGQLLNAIWAVRAHAVVVLPNDPDTVLAAQAAARAAAEDGLVVEVVPAVAAVQGLSALAVFDPGHDLASTVAAMQEAVSSTRHGALTTAAADRDTPAGPCRAGQALGLVDGRIVAVADDPDVTGRVVIDELLSGAPELLTAVAGAGADREAMARLMRQATARHTDVEVSWVEGGQRTYPWLFGAE